MMDRQSSTKSPVVYIVATPIGNLDDLTPRARHILAGVDMIAAEDTRQTRKLLSHLGIQGKRLVSYHNHNEAGRATALIAEIQAEELSLAVVSDAGTPCISDPGYRIVAAAKAAGVRVHPIPGPSALTTLVSASGLPSDRILYVGFLPTRVGAQTAEISSWSQARAAIVFFESTRRLTRTLVTIRGIYPEAQVAVGRELTKLFEEIVTAPIDEVLAWLKDHATLKGEATVMLSLGGKKLLATAPGGGGDAGSTLTASELLAEAAGAFAEGATLKDLLRRYQGRAVLSDAEGERVLKRTELYDLLLRAKETL